MCCGCAGWQPSGTHDTPLISCVYLLVWETGTVGENMGEGIQVLYDVYVYVCSECVCCVYGAPMESTVSGFLHLYLH